MVAEATEADDGEAPVDLGLTKKKKKKKKVSPARQPKHVVLKRRGLPCFDENLESHLENEN